MNDEVRGRSARHPRRTAERHHGDDGLSGAVQATRLRQGRSLPEMRVRATLSGHPSSPGKIARGYVLAAGYEALDHYTAGGRAHDHRVREGAGRSTLARHPVSAEDGRGPIPGVRPRSAESAREAAALGGTGRGADRQPTAQEVAGPGQEAEETRQARLRVVRDRHAPNATSPGRDDGGRGGRSRGDGPGAAA